MKAVTRHELLADLREEMKTLRSESRDNPIFAAIACGDREKVSDYSLMQNLAGDNVVFSANMSEVILDGYFPASLFGQLQRILVFQDREPTNHAVVSLISLLRRHEVGFEKALPESDHSVLHWWVERVIHFVKPEFRPLWVIGTNVVISTPEVEGTPGIAWEGVDDLLTASIQYLTMAIEDEQGGAEWEIPRLPTLAASDTKNPDKKKKRLTGVKKQERNDRIRELYRAGEVTQVDLSERFSLATSTISEILNAN